MIAVDTNLLVYAHRQDSAWHDVAKQLMEQLVENRSSWGLPWPCVHEFLAIVTHPKIYSPPSKMESALDQVDAWLECPSVVLLAEGEGHVASLRRVLTSSRVRGPQVHDARVAAICQQHGVDEIWTADRDFSRFPGIRARNPLVK